MKIALSIAAASLLLAACSGSNVNTTPGTRGAACYPNGTCNTGLACVSNVCVTTAADSGADRLVFSDGARHDTRAPDGPRGDSARADGLPPSDGPPADAPLDAEGADGPAADTTVDGPASDGLQPPVVLTVVLKGAGSGTVTSTPGTINCGSTCLTKLAAGTKVTLSAHPKSGSVFCEWGSTCGWSTNTTCQLTLSAAITVDAWFATSANPTICP